MLSPTRSALPAALAATGMLLPVLVIAGYSNFWTGGDGLAEMVLFGPTGAALLTGRWGSVFADPVIQGGPLELLPFGLAQLLGVRGTVAWSAYTAGFMAVVTLCVLATVLVPGRHLPARAQAAVGVAVGALGIFSGGLPTSVTVGHPAQALIPCLWVLAARAARRREPVLVGLLVGLSALLEPWGVLGAPVAFCTARPDLLRSAAAGLGVLLVGYGPFVATGHFAMLSFHWGIADQSLVGALWPDLTSFPWTLRLLQAVVALLVGTGVAVALRQHASAVFLVPLAVLLARLLLDPLLFPYYFVAPSVVALAAVGAALLSGRYLTALLWTGAALWFLQTPGRTWTASGAVLLALVGLALLTGRRSGAGGAPPPVRHDALQAFSR